ncbi:MAG: glycosyltransferase [Chthonomonadales bacterium]|nr:glycosyltransferase [Chthonomonadales bacterium]
MSRTAPILILTAAAGDGHRSAARSLEKACAALGVPSVLVDALDLAPRWFRLWFQGGYEGLVRHAPSLWGSLYRRSDRPGLFYAIQTGLDLLCLGRMERLIRQIDPDWALCVHSVAQPRLARIRRRLRRPGMAVVITDLHPHRMWLRGEPDRFFVPAARTLELLDKRLPGSGERTQVTGIPIDPECGALPPRAAVRRQLGLAESGRRILVMAGGIGAGPLPDVLRALADLPDPTDLDVVCGRNPHALRACRTAMDRARSASPRITVHGYVPHERFLRHLAAADLIVGKPGGITLSEALALGVPLVVYRPLSIPGQEDDNGAYLDEIGAGAAAGNRQELRDLIQAILGDETRLMTMAAAARAAGRPDAAAAIITAICGADRQGMGRRGPSGSR